jgi:branched-chain amino acid transport system permease protein
MGWSQLGQQVFYGLTNGMAYALFAIGLSLIWGIVGVINLAHGELYMLGAMLAWLAETTLGLNFFGSAIVSIVVLGAVGILCNRVAVQPLLGVRNFLLVTLLSTLGLSMIFMNGAIVVWGDISREVTTPFSEIIKVGGIQVSADRIVTFAVTVGAVLLLHFFLTRSKLGKALRASAQSSFGARLVGIDLKRIYALGFALGAALAALAGISLAPIWFAYPHMGQTMLIKGFVTVILAGLGSIYGCVAAGLFIGLAESLFGYYISVYYREAFCFVIMVIILLVKPTGLFQKAG